MTEGQAACPALTGVGAQRLRDGQARIVVVGAGGWLGLATLELLHGLLDEAFHARVKAFGSSARVLRLRGGLAVRQYGLSDLRDLPAGPTFVLHNAFLTQEKAALMSETDYRGANAAISSAVVDALDPIGAEGVFVPSSGAVYSVDRPEAPASTRLYGRLKLEDEARFAAWAERGGKRAVIARVFNLSGPYINKQASYALACFIADALAGRPIEIRATRPVYRSYVAISELVSVVLGALTDGASGVTLFDTAGERPYEMSEIAGTVDAVLGGGLGVKRPPLGNDEADHYVGDATVYAELRHGFDIAPVDFLRQVVETARFIAGTPGSLDWAGGI